MTFQQFLNEVEEQLKLYLPKEYQDVGLEIRPISKLNEQYTGLVVSKEGLDASPVFNMENMYQEYLSGTGISDVLGIIANHIEKDMPKFELKQFEDYESARDKLFIRVCSAEKNREILEQVPHQIEGDLAITYHFLINSGGNEIGSAMITNQIMEQLGITKEQLHADAIENSPKILPAKIEPMMYTISRILNLDELSLPESFDAQLKEITLNDGDMVVLTNKEVTNGASTMFYPGLLEKIGEQVGGNFFILPSSQHETILVPDNGSLFLKDLEAMVKEINRTEVREKDFLSDTVYHYDTAERKLEIAHTYEDRKASLEEHSEKPKERISVKEQLKEAEKVCEKQVSKPKEKSKDTMLE